MFYRHFVAFIAWLGVICIALVFLRTDHTCKDMFSNLLSYIIVVFNCTAAGFTTLIAGIKICKRS